VLGHVQAEGRITAQIERGAVKPKIAVGVEPRVRVVEDRPIDAGAREEPVEIARSSFELLYHGTDQRNPNGSHVRCQRPRRHLSYPRKAGLRCPNFRSDDASRRPAAPPR